MKGLREWIKACKQGVAILMLASLMGIGVNSLRPGGLTLDKNWFPAVSSSSSIAGESLFISLEAAKHHFIDSTALFLDARSAEDYHQGHIKGALNLPFHQLEEQFIAIAEKLPSEKLIITYCDGENCRLSHELAWFLIDNGFKHVKVLIDGWTLWQHHRLPVNEETRSTL